MKAVLLVSILVCTGCAHGEVISFPLQPAATDPQIKTFTNPHYIYIDRDIVVDHLANRPADRHELLLFIPGTGGKGKGPVGFLTLAASLGYHVINLMYPDDVPATTCAMDQDPTQFEKFRMALFRGGSASIKGGRERFTVAPSESIQNRLVKALARLQQVRPREGWGQFLNKDGSANWPSIAVAGQSQGGGHAALIGQKCPVERVLCFGAPKDYSIQNNAPAAWYSNPSVTPKSRFFAFNHHQDPKGCTPTQLLQNLAALGLAKFGPIAEVDSEPFPYHHAHILYTSYPSVTVQGPNSDGAKAAHGSAINTKNADRWKKVWTYMLTENVR
jgi:hypothetical protein